MRAIKTYLSFIFIIAAVILVGILVVGAFFVSAQSQDNIEFPIAELGNCESREDCAVYCDDFANIDACVDFAEEYDLMSENEIEEARSFAQLGVREGPGGCSGREECENYCEDSSHMRECVIFAKEHNLMPADEMREAEMVLAALDRGVNLPGGCVGKDSCDAYCEEDGHLEECINFAEAAGFMSAEEAVMVRKTGGRGPGDCRGKNECEGYCEDQANMEECINFAIEYDILPHGELEEAQKALKAIQSGVPMPNCRGREECDAYCQNPAHAEECFEFAVAAGFIDEDEAEQARKMMERGITTGPGGCSGREECEEYCENPDNSDECLEFSLEAGFMTAEEFRRAKERPEGERMGGPGGCRSEEECEEECESQDNLDECMGAAIKSGKMSPGEMENMKQMMRQQHEFPDGEPKFRDSPPPEFRDDVFEDMNDMRRMKEDDREIFMDEMEIENDMFREIENGVLEEIREEMRGEMPTDSFIPDEDTMCERFAAAPSCDFVPEEVRAMCEECKN